MSEALDPLERALARAHHEASEMYEDERYEEAEELLRRCLALADELGDRGEHAKGTALNTLAGVLRYTDREAEALEANLQALEILERHLAEDDYDLAGTEANVAQLCRNQGRLDEAERHFRRAIDLKRKSLGVDAPDVAREQVSLARLLDVLDRAEEAEAVMAEAWKQALKDQQGDTLAEVLMGICQYLAEKGHAEKALALCDEAATRLSASYATDYRADMNRPGWVLDYGLASYIVLRKEYQNGGGEPPALSAVRETRAQLLMSLERFAEAVADLERVDRSYADHARYNEECSRGVHDDDDSDLMIGMFGMGDEDEDAAHDESESDEDDDFEEDDDDDEDLFDDEDFIERVDASEGEFRLLYGTALHFLGQQRQDRALLERGRSQYVAARPILEEACEHDDPLLEQLAANLEEIESDLKSA